MRVDVDSVLSDTTALSSAEVAQEGREGYFKSMNE